MSLTLLILSMFCLAAAIASWVLVGMVSIASHRSGRLDVPGERQSHTTPTATGGGIGIMAALVITSLVISAWQPLDPAWTRFAIPAVSLLSLIGWLDDQRPLSVTLRLFVQLGVSIGLVVFLHSNGGPVNWLWVGTGGVAVVWVMNLYNFMDGSHGMAGFQGVFSGLLLGTMFLMAPALHLAVPAFLLAAVCAGFLPRNFPRASIFMGDAGSVPLGFAIAALAGLGLAQNLLTLPQALLVLSVFTVDSTLTLLRRVIRGEQWYTAHKQHMYQRLIARGWPHSQVLYLYQAINLLVVVPVAVLVNMYPNYAWHLTVLMYLLMMTGWFLASPRLGVQN